MKRLAPALLILVMLLVGCFRKNDTVGQVSSAPAAATLSVSSGDKQVGTIGAPLSGPLVIQANDAQGNGVSGVSIHFEAVEGVRFDPAFGQTDSSGQFSTQVNLGDVAGRYKIRATSTAANDKQIETSADEIGLGYQQALGRELDNTYCSRCHNSESTPERVSNYDNLTAKPHSFTEGETFNKLSDSNLELLISHGGPALNRSAEMPAYGYTLTKDEIRALVSYIRAISDPPFQSTGVMYANH